jgi:heptosyltransferase-2
MDNMQTKILIIKLGYSETLDPEIGKVPSLGDVLRTTPILWAVKEKYPDSHVTWLVTSNAEPLLLGNHLIDRILVWDEFIPFQLMREKFDILINLEKIAGVCALADMIDAWVKYGFRFDSLQGKYHAYEKGLAFIGYIENKQSENDKKYWQQVLIDMMGVEWKGQPYIIGYKPKSVETLDIGFNYEVGSKWPFKGMPMEKWKELEQRLTVKGFSVSWQEGKSNLFEYMDWINSCRLLLSTDSLGLHIASGMGKKTVGLFGPTSITEVYSYPGCHFIRSETDCPCLPCAAAKCQTGKRCMSAIDCNDVVSVVTTLLKEE